MYEPTEVKKIIESCLSEMKAIDVVSLKVSDLTSITDYMIICTGRSNRHLHSIAEKLIETCREKNISPLHASGLDSDEWIVVDCNDVIVHILIQDMRDFYQLEKLWSVTDSKSQGAQC